MAFRMPGTGNAVNEMDVKASRRLNQSGLCEEHFLAGRNMRY
ncbi:hypothetical protein HMPREF0358_1478 [Escherichia coli 83972]|nr:hypothetical protein HMPREF0358_1478 [Escherichia coli 83972]